VDIPFRQKAVLVLARSHFALLFMLHNYFAIASAAPRISRLIGHPVHFRFWFRPRIRLSLGRCIRFWPSVL